MHPRTSLRSSLLLAVAALLVPAVVACQPAAPAAQTAPPAPTPTAAAKPTTAPTAAASPAVAVSPAPAAASPVAKPAASPAAAASPSPAAAQSFPKPAAPPAPTGNDLGSASNPVKMAFVPSQDSQKVLASGEPLGKLLQEATNLNFQVSVPTSFTAVIEAMGANQADVGWLSPFAYVLAKDKNYADVALASIRGGSKTYTAQIIVRADSGITSVEQLKGKRFAFVDPASASGFLFPNAFLAQKGIDYKTFFSETAFAGGHDKVVIAVYNKQVDGGATFGDSVPGQVTDARTSVQSTLPDVMTVVKPIAVTDPIPNDTVSIRRGMPANLTKLITDGLLYVQSTPDGKKLLKDLYNIDGLATASDSEYTSIRTAAKALNLNLEEQIAPPKPKP